MRRYPPPKTGSHTGRSPGRDRAAQGRFRKALLKRAQGRCEVPGCDTPYDRLQAHHTSAGYTPDDGILVCWHHHHELDPYAR